MRKSSCKDLEDIAGAIFALEAHFRLIQDEVIHMAPMGNGHPDFIAVKFRLERRSFFPVLEGAKEHDIFYLLAFGRKHQASGAAFQAFHCFVGPNMIGIVQNAGLLIKGNLILAPGST